MVDNINVEDYAKALNIGLHDEYVPSNFCEDSEEEGVGAYTHCLECGRPNE